MKLKLTMILSDQHVSTNLFSLLKNCIENKTSLVLYNRTVLSDRIKTVLMFDVEEINSKIILVGYVENIEKCISPFTKLYLNLDTLELTS